MSELMQYLPENWTGLAATLMIVVYIGAQIVEKHEAIAKIMPFGKWWHARQKKNQGARRDLVAEDNEVIQGLQTQVSSIVDEMRGLKETIRSFTAWSVYDSRWHHQVMVSLAKTGIVLPDHLDYFAFETYWKSDPIGASRLPDPHGGVLVDYSQRD